MENITLVLIIVFMALAIGLLMIFYFKNQKTENIENAFKVIAAQVLEEKNSSLTKENIERVSVVLEPFKEQIKELNHQISDLKKEQAVSKESFKNEVSKVIEQTSKISIDAENLTTALKGDSKKQGTWGEMVLEKTLEESGLRLGKDYQLQQSFRNTKGELLIPDAVIYLPGERNIIIDSKVSLKSYKAYIDSENETKKDEALKNHITSLKDHIKNLNSKGYNHIEKLNPPDYILIFVPLESALSLALTSDWDLQRLAMQNQIAFVTPTNLIAILRMAESLWKLDAQNENASNIAKRAGHLIDKFSGLNDDLENIGKYLNLAGKAFDAADNKLSSGKGNLFDQIKELEALGAKSKKLISKK